MGIWEKLKQERIEYYQKYIYGWKERLCTACNGSGYYDNTDSPICMICNGTGREKYPGPKTIGPYHHLLFCIHHKVLVKKKHPGETIYKSIEELEEELED